jgi:hypothetical protein
MSPDARGITGFYCIYFSEERLVKRKRAKETLDSPQKHSGNYWRLRAWGNIYDGKLNDCDLVIIIEDRNNFVISETRRLNTGSGNETQNFSNIILEFRPH